MSVRKILEIHYPAGEYVLMPEVSCGNGYMDWIAVGLWSSRGFPIIGHEEKAFRSDWLRELKKPAKQESHFKYLNQMYLLTTNDNVAKMEEIPEPWGWKHIKNDKVYTMKKAPQLAPEPIPKSFLTALIRRAASKEKYVHVDDIEDKIVEAAEKRKEHQSYLVKQELEEFERIKEAVKEFEEASGLKIFGGKYDWNIDPKLAGQAYSLLKNCGVEDMVDRLGRISRDIKNVLGTIDESIAPFVKIENTVTHE